MCSPTVTDISSRSGKIVDYIIKEAHKDEMGDYDPDEILFIVQGEMEYTESLEDE